MMVVDIAHHKRALVNLIAVVVREKFQHLPLCLRQTGSRTTRSR